MRSYLWLHFGDLNYPFWNTLKFHSNVHTTSKHVMKNVPNMEGVVCKPTNSLYFIPTKTNHVESESWGHHSVRIKTLRATKVLLPSYYMP